MNVAVRLRLHFAQAGAASALGQLKQLGFSTSGAAMETSYCHAIADSFPADQDPNEMAHGLG